MIFDPLEVLVTKHSNFRSVLAIKEIIKTVNGLAGWSGSFNDNVGELHLVCAGGEFDLDLFPLVDGYSCQVTNIETLKTFRFTCKFGKIDNFQKEISSIVNVMICYGINVDGV